MDYKGLGHLAIKNGDLQEALNIFKRLIEKGGRAEGYFGFGLAARGLGEEAAARWAFSRALEHDPSNAEAARLIEAIDGAPRPSRKGAPGSAFRVAASSIERLNGGAWERFFIKGVNLGLGLPGHFPGEYAVMKGTYLKWFGLMRELGANAVRVYAVQTPGFYEALHEFNASGPPIYLMQGIWVELPEDNALDAPPFVESVKQAVRTAVDAVYGKASLPERPGMPAGTYTADVSAWTLAFLFGREWEACPVRAYNEKAGRETSSYEGRFLSIAGATPFERWVTAFCDYVQEYEDAGYGLTHPVSPINWPTLDPVTHPSEAMHEDEKRFFTGAEVKVCSGWEPDEDIESLDVAKIKSLKGAGFFASYHVYPYYPDFISNDHPERAGHYELYLKALVERHAGMPLVIAEFGVPTSREVAHWQPNGWTHGGHNEAAQGMINAVMLKTVRETGCAGAVLFSWFDEWFKHNWMSAPYELPPERNPLWFNSQDAEQNYGLLAAYPGYPGKKVTLSGNKAEWPASSDLYVKKDGPPLHRFNDGSDPSRTLTRLSMRHDEGFLYIRLEAKGPVDFSRAAYLIGLDTIEPEAGEFALPYGVEASSPVGLKFLISLVGKNTSRVLACHTYDKYLNADPGVIRPSPSREGAWVVMQNKTNNRRLSKDLKRFYPARVYPMSPLTFGSLDRKAKQFDSSADFFHSGNALELRLPWGLLNFTDPSSKTVLWAAGGSMTRRTDGIRAVACSYKPVAGRMTARKTGKETNLTDCLPSPMAAAEVKTYAWEGWDAPIYHTYLKESFGIFRDALKEEAGQ